MKIVHVTKVYSKNFVSDFFSSLRNIIGGRLKQYESLIEEAITNCAEEFEEKYPEATSIRIDKTEFTNGAIAVTISGVILDF